MPHGILKDKELIETYSFEKKDFTRTRKLPFITITLLILRLLKSSVKTELKSFHTTIIKADEVCNWITASGFCRARQKIKHQLFIDLYKFIVRWLYAHIGGRRWFHFGLLANYGHFRILKAMNTLRLS